MAEMRNLLSFMESADRDRALARYEELFARVGPAEEDKLIGALGSALRQVLALEKEYRLAQKDGKVPFTTPLPLPEGISLDAAAEPAPEGPERDAAEEPTGEEPEEPEPAEVSAASFVRDAAGALEDDPSAEETWEAISSLDEDFPLGNLIPPDEPPLKTGEIVFPEVIYGLPEEEPSENAGVPAAAPESDDEPATEPVNEPDALPTGEPTAEESTPATEETPLSTEPKEPEPGEPSPEPAEERTDETVSPEPASAGPQEKAAMIAAAPEGPAEPAPGHPKTKPERTAAKKKSSSPGAGRIFAAILVTFPFIILWIVSFALFLTLGLAVMAVGFVCCAAGVYFAGYVLHGAVSFMPDLLLIGGGALVCFALALLFLWTGLWIAVGGFASVIRWTGSVYRRILRKKVPRKGGDQ